MEITTTAEKTALLTALLPGPGYGSGLIERESVRTGGKVQLHQGSVYRALRAMEREGLLESYVGEEVMPGRRRRQRRYYRLTSHGLRAALEAGNTPVWLLLQHQALVP